MSTQKVLNMEGKEAGDFTFTDALIEKEKGSQAVHDSVVAFLAGIRSGTASTKTRSEVRSTGKKPYRQKGTGRARAGSRVSPIWRGGGITFGPKPRSYRKKVNKKVNKLALKRAFSERVEAGEMIIVNEIKFAEPKTKEMVTFLIGINAGTRTLILINERADDDGHINTYLAGRNLPEVTVVDINSVNPYLLLLHKKVVVTTKALEAFAERLK